MNPTIVAKMVVKKKTNLNKGDLLHIPQGAIIYKYDPSMDLVTEIIITKRPEVGIYLEPELLSTNDYHKIIFSNETYHLQSNSIYKLTKETNYDNKVS
jgi:hypothetical protein